MPGKHVGIPVSDEISGSTMFDDGQQATDSIRNDWRSTSCGFQCDKSEAFTPARDQNHVCSAVIRAENVVGLWLDELHSICDSQLVSEFKHAMQFGLALSAARTTDDQ